MLLGRVLPQAGTRRVQLVILRSRSDSIESHIRASTILPPLYNNHFKSLGGVRVCDALCVWAERLAECAGDNRTA